MKVIVCGSRDEEDRPFVWKNLERLHLQWTFTDLMQGGATGVDTFAREWAYTRYPAIIRRVCEADWSKFGRAAGPIRNARMLEWLPDLVIAFPGNDGTADMVRQAKAAGVCVIGVERA